MITQGEITFDFSTRKASDNFLAFLKTHGGREYVSKGKFQELSKIVISPNPKSTEIRVQRIESELHITEPSESRTNLKGLCHLLTIEGYLLVD